MLIMIVDKSRPYKAIIHPAQEATMVTLVYTKPAKEIWIREHVTKAQGKMCAM